MTITDTIPANIVVRLIEFLNAKRTGKIIMNIKRGSVMTVEFSETVSNEELKQKEQTGL